MSQDVGKLKYRIAQVHHIHVFIFKVKQTVPVRYNQNGGHLENEIKMD
jgi:hypothetical protein